MSTCPNFEDKYHLQRIIAEGGSSFIIEGYLNSDSQSPIVFKLCKGYMGNIACNLFSREANVIRDLTVLRQDHICYNFPIFYDFGSCCLFLTPTQFDRISNLGITITDALWYYANVHTTIPDFLYTGLMQKYTPDVLLSIKDSLKIKNFKVLESRWPLNPNSLTQNNIYDFLEDDISVGCGNYIVINRIYGKNLAESGLSMLDLSLIFDMIYANACTIKYYNFVISDVHDDNIMISPIDHPRIYEIGGIYYMFNTSSTLIYIDFQATSDVFETSPSGFSHRHLYTTSDRYFPPEIVTVLRQSSPNLDTFMYSVLPSLFSQFVISSTYVKQLLIKYPQLQIAHYVIS